MTDVLRLRKQLSGALAIPQWPAGIRLAPVSDVAPDALHALLATAYANGFGSVPPLDEWWPAITADTEYDPDLWLVAIDATGQPVGLALCWTSGFIKDIAVSQAARGQGVGEALLHAAFAACHRRGLDHVDLKVIAANHAAIRLYRRVGMDTVPL